MTSLALETDIEVPLPQPQIADAVTPVPQWRLATRITFRFSFVYFILWLLPFPIGRLPMPGSTWFLSHWQSWTRAATAWTGTHVVRLTRPIIYQQTGSGDTLANYVRCLAFLLAAAVITAVWSVLDRRRTQYRKLYPWLALYVRYGLAAIMLGYGLGKVWPLQMSYPSLDRLVEPLGDFSPMGLLWTMLGFSGPYEAFGGWGETIGAVLLFSRRTSTAGALLLMAVMTNVFMMNMSYDVPVKLHSLHYVVMATFIAAADFPRLFTLLALNRATAPREAAPLFPWKWARIAGTVAASVFVVTLIYPGVVGSMSRYATTRGAPNPPLFGIYNVTQFVRNGVDAADLASGPTWKRFTLNKSNAAAILSTTEAVNRYNARVDTTAHVLTFTAGQNGATLGSFTYSIPDSGRLVLSGRVGADSIDAELERYDTQMVLTSRGFHWIQELPFNR